MDDRRAECASLLHSFNGITEHLPGFHDAFHGLMQCAPGRSEHVDE